ncbi:hypothetical protein HanRHA438_Chr00c62g0860221 [Helianthus annuus]|nr:hypothetical protein HanRHA438_Chr00c62g0860221 [Helianthus annuus]
MLILFVSEYEVIEISENVCNLKKLEADWILKIDIVEQGDRLEVMIVVHLIFVILSC